MNIVILGWATITNGDISPNKFLELGDLKVYDVLPEEEVCKVVADAEAILVNRVNITKKVILSAPKLKYIGSFATGYNNIDMVTAKERGVTVTNVPGYSTEAVATHAFAFLLALALRLVDYNNHVKAGNWSFAPGADCFPFRTNELRDKTLGIFGFGSIGKRVAELANAFGMKVIFYSRKTYDVPFAKQVDFDTLLKESDFLSLHAPLTTETNKRFGAEEFGKMKPTAYFINTARGGLMDEDALAYALDNGIIAGAATDVTTKEPLDTNSALFSAKNCIFTPHVAWGPTETRNRLITLGYENLESFIKGNPLNVVEG